MNGRPQTPGVGFRESTASGSVSNSPTPHGPTTPATRPKFETLFAEPRHYRGDCRLMRSAIRRGWLDDAPQADRDALVARFEQATTERHAAGFVSDGQALRVALAEAEAALELGRSDQRAAVGVLRCYFGAYITGRPRERWHVGDYADRLDANELRRRAKADGMDLRTLQAIELRPAGKPDDAGERVALSVVADARYGWRLWLVCPRCGSRRAHLYPLRAGVACRKCAGIAYAHGE